MNVTTALRAPAALAALTLLLFPLVKSEDVRAEEKEGAIVVKDRGAPVTRPVTSEKSR